MNELLHGKFLFLLLFTCFKQKKDLKKKKKTTWLFNRGLTQPTPVLLPGKFHGWRSLVGYSPWGHKESDMTERLHLTELPTEMYLLRKIVVFLS